jgi:hypothetical protein
MVQNIPNMHSVVFLGVTKHLTIQSQYTNQQQQCLHKKELQLLELFNYQAAPNANTHHNLCQPTGSPSLLYCMTY